MENDMSDHLIVQPSPPKRGGTRRGPRVTIVQLLFRAMQRWQRRRATANLQGLTDGQLADIGLSRNDIPRVPDCANGTWNCKLSCAVSSPNSSYWR